MTKQLVRGPFQFPTSQSIREDVTPKVAEKLTGESEFLEPKDNLEKFGGNLVSDITAFFTPGTGQMRLAHRIGVPLAGNLAKEGVEYLGADEDIGDTVKLGTMLMSTIAGISNPSRYGNQLVSQARNQIPDVAISSAPLAKRLEPLWNRINRGLTGVSSKSKVKQGINDLADQAKSGKLTTQSLMDARNDINEFIAEAGGFDVPEPVRKSLIHNLNELKSGIIQTIDENLNSINPKAAQMYKNGYEALAVTNKSNAIGNFIQKHFGKPVRSLATKALFPGLAGSAFLLPKIAATGGALFPMYKAGQVLYRVAQSPTLSRYYANVLRYASKEIAPAMSKNFKDLDNNLYEEEKKQFKKEKLLPKKTSLEEYKSRFRR